MTLGLSRDAERPRILHAAGGYTLWRDHLTRRWRWSCTWADDGWGLATHGGASSLLGACRAVARHQRTRAALAANRAAIS